MGTWFFLFLKIVYAVLLNSWQPLRRYDFSIVCYLEHQKDTKCEGFTICLCWWCEHFGFLLKSACYLFPCCPPVKSVKKIPLNWSSVYSLWLLTVSVTEVAAQWLHLLTTGFMTLAHAALQCSSKCSKINVRLKRWRKVCTSFTSLSFHLKPWDGIISVNTQVTDSCLSHFNECNISCKSALFWIFL